MPSFSNYISTATQCSSFEPQTTNSISNISEGSMSCLYCKNFEKNHCKLDLYDKINNTE